MTQKGQPRRLVRDAGAWTAWVNDHEGELRSMVAQGERADVFVSKVRSAMNLPSSGVVADALSRLKPPLVVDATALEEVQKRNVAAHHLRMNKPGVDYEVDRDVERVDILRSLLVALVARACDHDGAIAGWVRGSAAGWKPPPDWWPSPSSATLEEAQAGFSCERGENPTRSRASTAPTFRSRLRTKTSPRISRQSRAQVSHLYTFP